MKQRTDTQHAHAWIDPSRRPFTAALMLGLSHAIAFALLYPPFEFWPLAFLALVPLILIAAHTSNPRRSAIAVWIAAIPAFGFHHFWLTDVTLPGTPILVMYMSLYPALFVWMLAIVRSRLGFFGLYLAAALLWPAFEFVRGEIFLQGYPWFLLGHASPSPHPVGAYFVTLLLSLVNSVLAVLFLPTVRERFRQGIWIKAPLLVIVLGLVVNQLLPDRPATDADGTLRIALVQTNVPQSNKMSDSVADKLDYFDHALELTIEAARQEPTPDLIVWPETMVPVVWGLNDASYEVEKREGITIPIETPEGPRRLPTTLFRDELTRLQTNLGIPFLVGATAVEGLTFDVDEAGSITVDYDARYNSAFLIEDGAVNERRYDKLTLTPFGEVMPYISNWPWLEQQLLALGARGMSFDLEPGEEDFVFEVNNASGETFRIATPICFEITYAETCRRLAFDGDERKADILLNLTNDGWFTGWDPGREMHLDSGRWRAAELATPVLRAANTGISCYIDARGREISRLPPNEGGVLVVEVAKGVGVPAIARMGFAIPWGLTIASLALLAVAGLRGRTNSQAQPASSADEDQQDQSTNAS